MQVLRSSLLVGASSAKAMPVVIDVFRAFTSCAILVHKGIQELLLVDDPEQALALKKQSDYLAIGEVGGQIYPGFDFPNSPSVLLGTPAKIFSDRKIVCSTSSGTKGVVLACQNTGMAILGSYVMAASIARFIRKSAQVDAVTLIAAGAGGNSLAVEDEECANYIDYLLTGATYDHLKSVSNILNWEDHKNILNNKHLHFPVEDMIIALQRDIFSFVMIGRGSRSPIQVEWVTVDGDL